MSRRCVLATISLDESAGGIQRNIVGLANKLARQGRGSSLITFDYATARSFYPIDKGVRWYKVGITRPHGPIGFGDRIRLVLAIRKALKDAGASVVVCFHHGILVRFVLASLFTGIRIIVSERISLTIYDHIKASKWNLNFMLLFLVDQIVVQFPRYIDDYPRLLRSRIVAIPNPVHPPSYVRPDGENDTRRPFELLTVGRLCFPKNYEPLIAAFAELASRYPDWELVIVGNGDMRERLHEEILRHGLEARVRMIPAITSISDAYRRASLFCMPSRSEGFPNALAEAMAHGLPVIGYRECAGVKDLIVHGETGLLADGNGDTHSLSEALDVLMANSERRKAMGKAAKRYVQRFHPDRIFPQWEALLNQVETDEGNRGRGMEDPDHPFAGVPNP